MRLPLFEAATGHALEKLDFKQQQDSLHADLLKVQRDCREAGIPVLILVSGVEAAGKSAVVNRLSKWLDMRNVRTVSYWRETEDERRHPRDWRFWRDLPGRGEISILFGSWYTEPIVQAATNPKHPKKALRRLLDDCAHIDRFERLLANDGVVFVKLWFHITKKEQTARIKAKQKAGHRLTPYEMSLPRYYRDFARVSHRVIELTDNPVSPWHVIDASDHHYRDMQAGQVLLAGLRAALQAPAAVSAQPPFEYADQHLFHVGLDKQLDPEKYERQLDKYQARLADLHWRATEQGRSTVLVFEGWDAAGKGGSIRRLTAAMDARLYRVIPIAAPTDEERAHHYLWRFWRQLPLDGYVTIFDRSWYGRVLVERVEGFAKPAEWQRAYEEINDFEQQLCRHGTVVAKFWLHISPEEQLQRFEQRQVIEYKQHKLTDEDWRNREKWAAYEQAVDDMLARTGRADAPWFVIPANNKLHARVEILKTVCRQLEKALDRN